MVTLGDEGSVFYNGQVVNEPGIKADAVDTTGAGDTCNGALAVALSEGMALDDAMKSIKIYKEKQLNLLIFSFLIIGN
ncbi:PfkB family carbohydrate kinase [Macrococcoides caseolyticum]|uniref:PfkB family carbohydrate kinase n=1 Tax=Macrococcoides caseolyticum TaxID=69966 RepID=UPI001E4ACFD3|nr:PfkB family carbohydrate kinase [Macrococcus caseolyticus]